MNKKTKNTVKYVNLTPRERKAMAKRFLTIHNDIKKETEALRKEGFFDRD